MSTIIGKKTEKAPVYYELISPKVANTILLNNAGKELKLLKYLESEGLPNII